MRSRHCVDASCNGSCRYQVMGSGNARQHIRPEWQSRADHGGQRRYRPREWPRRLPGREQTFAIWGTNPDKNQSALQKLEAIGVEAAAFVCNVAEPDAVNTTMAHTFDRFGRIDACFRQRRCDRAGAEVIHGYLAGGMASGSVDQPRRSVLHAAGGRATYGGAGRKRRPRRPAGLRLQSCIDFRASPQPALCSEQRCAQCSDLLVGGRAGPLRDYGERDSAWLDRNRHDRKP